MDPDPDPQIRLNMDPIRIHNPGIRNTAFSIPDPNFSFPDRHKII
jgi:hypothetical protein